MNEKLSCKKNVFSVDVEGFVESNQESFNVPQQYINSLQENNEIETNTNAVLELLDELKIKGTFFFLGRMAKDIPNLLKTVAKENHEIGCHNYLHLRVFNLKKEVFEEKISEAKRRIEDVAGKAVYGFRAPDFSITEKSIWAIEVLKKVGFVYDSSIYPLGLHDVYGIKNARRDIHTFKNDLIEIPLSAIDVLGRRIPFGGGGYFRLYPIWVTKAFIKLSNKNGRPCVFYIHPYEVGPIVPKIKEMSFYRKFRHYYNVQNGAVRLRWILRSFEFVPAIELLKQERILK